MHVTQTDGVIHRLCALVVVGVVALRQDERNGARPLPRLSGDPRDGAPILVDRRLLVLAFRGRGGIGGGVGAPKSITRRWLSRYAGGGTPLSWCGHSRLCRRATTRRCRIIVKDMIIFLNVVVKLWAGIKCASGCGCGGCDGGVASGGGR